MNEFSRTELLLGRDGIRKLRESHVLVLGVGGVGSHCIEALARSGVGRLTLVDNDRVSLTNLNRQSIAYHSTIGQYKTRVMKARILDINPSARVETREQFVLADQVTELLADRPDFIVDAIDTVAAKLALAEAAERMGIPVISSMGTGNKLDPSAFEITDIYGTSVCPLCRVMRRELKKRGVGGLTVLYSREEPRQPETNSDSAGQPETKNNSTGLSQLETKNNSTSQLEIKNDSEGQPRTKNDSEGQPRTKSNSAGLSQPAINSDSASQPEAKNDSAGLSRPETKGATGRPAPGSVSFVPPVAGLMIAGYVIRKITGR